MPRLIAQVILKDAFFGPDGENSIKGYANTDSGSIGRLISSIIPTVMVVAGFILFLYLVFGGFLLMTSSGDSKKAESGKTAITNAIIGFALIFTSYWIIQIIEIITGVSIVK